MNVVGLSADSVATALETPTFSKSRKFQRGHGIFASIGAALIPIISQFGKYLLNRGSQFIDSTTESVRSGASLGNALKESAAKTFETVKSDFKRKMRGGGKKGLYKKKQKRFKVILK